MDRSSRPSARRIKMLVLLALLISTHRSMKVPLQTSHSANRTSKHSSFLTSKDNCGMSSSRISAMAKPNHSRKYWWQTQAMFGLPGSQASECKQISHVFTCMRVVPGRSRRHSRRVPYSECRYTPCSSFPLHTINPARQPSRYCHILGARVISPGRSDGVETVVDQLKTRQQSNHAAQTSVELNKGLDILHQLGREDPQ